MVLGSWFFQPSSGFFNQAQASMHCRVVESLPKKTSEMWGKCPSVCARAISDSEPERVNLGWSLFQFLPRLTQILSFGGIFLGSSAGLEPALGVAFSRPGCSQRCNRLLHWPRGQFPH